MVRIPTHGPPTHPGEMLLEEFLKPMGLSQTELAEKMGVSYPRVNELIHGKRGVTPDTALRLEQLFGMEAQFLSLIHISEPTRLRRISYAVFCLKKKKKKKMTSKKSDKH